MTYDYLEEYFQFLEGNRITIIGDIEESDESYFFRYCLYDNYTETGDAEINKEDYLSWLSFRDYERGMVI